MSLPASSSAYRSCDPRLYDVLWRESELASQVGLCQRHMQWRIWVPQRMPCLKHRKAHNKPYYNMSFYKKSRLLSNTSMFDYHILDPNSKSISFSPTYLYHNQPCQKICVFLLKRRSNIWKKKRHTQNTTLSSHQKRQAMGAKAARALLLGSIAALEQLKVKDVQSHEMPMEEEATFGRRETSFRNVVKRRGETSFLFFLTFFFGWESVLPWFLEVLGGLRNRFKMQSQVGQKGNL